jgi:hypothetical protein
LNQKAKIYIDYLNLIPHPEGGYFKEVYRSGEMISQSNLPVRYTSPRTFSTSIYFLLEGEQVSKFHRLKSDEQWHFYDGSTILLYTINCDGELCKICLGNRIEHGETFQTIIKRATWFGAELMDKYSFALLGCTVAPGFDFNDFELADRENLLKDFPRHKNVIVKLTD